MTAGILSFAADRGEGGGAQQRRSCCFLVAAAQFLVAAAAPCDFARPLAAAASEVQGSKYKI
jgi:hypothetical protein